MKPATTLALVALAASLGGCKSFVQAFDFSRHSSGSQYAIGPTDLEEGRAHLRAGRVGNALAPLHRAALDPASSGDALNALGVAYAKLGRADLAERYFIAATRVDAGNPAFAANLDRFYRSELANDARLAHAQRERAREQFAAFAQSEQSLAAATPTSEERLVSSGGEVRRITISRGAASQRVALGRPEIIGKAAAAPAPARVKTADGTALTSQIVSRPAEIRLQTRQPSGAARVRVGQAEAGTKYPLRIRLPDRQASQGGNR